MDLVYKRSKVKRTTPQFELIIDVWANCEKDPIGIGCLILSKKKFMPFFLNFFVEKGYRRKGIATNIVIQLVDWLNEFNKKRSRSVYVLYEPEARLFWDKQLPFLRDNFKTVFYEEYREYINNEYQPPLQRWERLNNSVNEGGIIKMNGVCVI